MTRDLGQEPHVGTDVRHQPCVHGAPTTCDVPRTDAHARTLAGPGRIGHWFPADLPGPPLGTRCDVGCDTRGVNRSPYLIALGALLFLVGVLWTLQGLGVVGGSVMSGVTAWAVIGPVVAVLGLALVLWPRRRP